MDFILVLPDTPILKEIIRLADRNKASLGLFPRGAFEDHAARKNIIAAVTSNGDLQGYILYRVVRGSEIAVIAHLCIDPRFRGEGVARALVGRLRRETGHLRGIRLRCRNDYAAHTVWPKLGFTPLRELPGRGKERKPLTEWWLDYGNGSLFDALPAIPKAPSSIRVAIDANIYFDLTTDRAQGRETRALRADWVESVASINWLVTPELQIELARGGNTQLAGEVALLEADMARFGSVLNEVLEILYGTRNEAGLSTRQLSDARQIAYAVAGGETTYLTRDEGILRKAVELRDHFSLDVLRPVELIERLDRIRDGQKYSPVFLHDRQLKVSSVAAGEIESLADHFIAPKERRGPLVGCMRSIVAQPNENLLQVVAEGTEPIALIGLCLTRGILQVPLMRVTRRGFAGDALARHMLWRAVEKAASQKISIVEYSDSAVDRSELLADCDFVQRGESWWRIQADGLCTSAQLETRLRQLATLAPLAAGSFVADLATRASHIENSTAAAKLERMLWPAFVMGQGVPTCLVPIRPHWAKELFDYSLARGYLFNPASNLLLNTENVYYSEARPPSILREGTRILWYVSRDAYEARALSICDAVHVGDARDLFREFRNLGIYGWKDIKRMIEDPITKEATDKEIVVIKFSHTRLLDPPVSLKRLKESCQATVGKKLSLQFPNAIDEAILQDVLASD